MEIIVDGENLTIEKVNAIARDGALVRIGEKAVERVNKCRGFIEDLVASGEAIYGVTTGIGEFARIRVSPEMGEQLRPDDFTDPLFKAMFELINRGFDKGAKSAPDLIGLTEDDELRRSISALICEPGLMVEEDAQKAAHDCAKALVKKPEERTRWKEEMKSAAKNSQDKGAQTDFIKAQEKYFETREK